MKTQSSHARHIGPSIFTPWGRYDLYLEYGWKKRLPFVRLFTTHNRDVVLNRFSEKGK